MAKEKIKEGEALSEGEASKKNEATPNLLNYEVFRYGDPWDNVDISELPKDMSDPECWERIAQFCRDKFVDIICSLDKPYNGSSVVVFKNSGNNLFFDEEVEDIAYDFATSEDVYVFLPIIEEKQSESILFGIGILVISFTNGMNKMKMTRQKDMSLQLNHTAQSLMSCCGILHHSNQKVFNSFKSGLV